jgi:hypothetical protein
MEADLQKFTAYVLIYVLLYLSSSASSNYSMEEILKLYSSDAIVLPVVRLSRYYLHLSEQQPEADALSHD